MSRELLGNRKNVEGNYEGGFKEINDIGIASEELKSNEFVMGNNEVTTQFDMVNLGYRIDNIGYRLTKGDAEYNSNKGKIELIEKLLMQELKGNEKAMELLDIYDECRNAQEATISELWYKQGVVDSDHIENGLIWNK